MAVEGKFKNLLDMIQKSLKNFPDRKLFGVKKAGQYQWMTYRDFGFILDEVRGGLAQVNIHEGDKIAAILDNSPEWAAACYAAHGLGAAYVPMYEKQNPSDWQYILEDSGAVAVVVGDGEIAKKVLDLKGTGLPDLQTVIVVRGEAPPDAISWDDLRKKGRDAPIDAIAIDEIDRVSCLIYTSGTTGQPKGVVLSHANITSNVNAIHALFPFQREDVSLSFLPWAHSFGQTCELHCMASMGAAMGLAENVTTIIPNLAEVHPTVLFSVPRIWNRVYDSLTKKIAKETFLKRKLMLAAIANSAEIQKREAKGQSLGFAGLMNPIYDKLVLSKIKGLLGGRLKFAFSGGAALSKEVGQFINDLGISVYEGYGLTETSPIATANRPGLQKIGSVGQALPGITVTINPSVIEGLEPGVGEVCIAGPNIMQGYHNLPEKTAEVLDENRVFRTGDLGRLDGDNFLFLTGRVKEQYKLENGKYVAPAPLEEKLKLSPFINQIMIHGQNLPFNSAIIVPDAAQAQEWASENGHPTSLELLLKLSEFETKILAEIEASSGTFKGFEKVRKVVLVIEEFSTDNDMLTPSLKVKRRNVMKAYGDALLALYKIG